MKNPPPLATSIVLIAGCHLIESRSKSPLMQLFLHQTELSTQCERIGHCSCFGRPRNLVHTQSTCRTQWAWCLGAQQILLVACSLRLVSSPDSGTLSWLEHCSELLDACSPFS